MSGQQGIARSVSPASYNSLACAAAWAAWTTLHLRYADEVGEALGIPSTITQLACVPTAYYTGDTFRPGKRRPAEEITYWNTWKNTEH